MANTNLLWDKNTALANYRLMVGADLMREKIIAEQLAYKLAEHLDYGGHENPWGFLVLDD